MTRPDSRYVRLAAKSLANELLWLLTCEHEYGALRISVWGDRQERPVGFASVEQ